MEWIENILVARFNYWIYIILMMIGLHAMIVKNNLVKKLIGMSIFQTAIILFFVSTGVKRDSTIPILLHDNIPGHQVESQERFPEGGAHSTNDVRDIQSSVEGVSHSPVIRANDYANPLPHVLMLTAIVVGVSTLGVSLGVVQRIYGLYGTVEENEILEKIKTAHG